VATYLWCFGFWCFWSSSGSLWSGWCSTSLGIFVDLKELGSNLDGVSFTSKVLLDDTSDGGADIDSDLVGFNSCNAFVSLDEFSWSYMQYLR